MRSALLLATSLGLFLAGSSSLRAANDPPATPPAPGSPATAAPATTNTVQATLIPGTPSIDTVVTDINPTSNNSWARVLMLNSHGSLPDKRVSVDEKNAKIKDVLKKVLDQAKVDYVFEQDVPEDDKVSVKLDNVQLATAIDAITDSTGLNWASETHDNKVIVHVGKSLRTNLNSSNIMATLSRAYTDAEKLAMAPQFNNSRTTLTMPQGPYTTSPFTFSARSRETRSTFTCPNCHNQVTILRKNIAPKCTTCGRTFEPGWKVCPFDGAKRPEAKDDWKFCPICGKPIPEGTLSSLLTPENFQFDPNLDGYGPVTTSPLRIEDAQHALYHELALPEAVETLPSLER